MRVDRHHAPHVRSTRRLVEGCNLKPQFGVIFDMDGVLVNSFAAHLESWQRVAVTYGVTMSSDDFTRTFGRTGREIIRQLWADRFKDHKVREFDEAKELEYRNVLREHFPEMDGASDLIEALHAAGFKLAIGSSGPKGNVEAVKSELRAGEFISATVDGGQVKHGKPEPDIFLRAAEKLGLEPGRCAVIEDAPVGLQAAKRAGMTAIALTGTADRALLATRADLVVDSLRELTPAGIMRLIRDIPKRG
jgi:beta-phosphoglucomutase